MALTRDTSAARPFYTDLFGWTFREVAEGYFTIDMGDLLIGGMRDMVSDPPQVPPHRMPYFVAGSAADAATRVVELGEQVVVPITDIPAPEVLRASGSRGGMVRGFRDGPGGTRPRRGRLLSLSR